MMRRNVPGTWPQTFPLRVILTCCTVGLLFCAATQVYAAYAVTPNPSTPQLAGVNVGNYRCDTAHPGYPQYVSTVNVAPSSYVGYAYGGWHEPDCGQIYQGRVTIAPYTDIQVCLRVYDYGGPFGIGKGYGPLTCGPWASKIAAGQSNGWSGWATDGDGIDPDKLMITIKTQSMPNRSVTNMRLSMQTADREGGTGGTGGCVHAFSPIRTTPWRSQGGGWSQWAQDTGDGIKINCYKSRLEVVVTSYSDLTATATNYVSATQSVATTTSYIIKNIGAGSTSVGLNSRIYFDYKRDGWDGNGVDGDFYVHTSGSALGAGLSRLVSPSVTFSRTGLWRAYVSADPSGLIAESNESNNNSAWDIFTVTPPPNPTVTLTARNVTDGGVWGGSNLTIDATDQVQMRWSSTDAVSCSKTFVSGTATSSAGADVTEPYAGTSTDYTVSCSGLTGTTPASDTIRVTSASSTPILVADDADKFVRVGDTVNFDWDLNGNDPAGCSFAGPGAPATIAGASDPFAVTIQGVSTYSLTCSGGAAEVDIQILPQTYES